MRIEELTHKMRSLIMDSGIEAALTAMLNIVDEVADEDPYIVILRAGLKKTLCEYKRRYDIDNEDGA